MSAELIVSGALANCGRDAPIEVMLLALVVGEQPCHHGLSSRSGYKLERWHIDSIRTPNFAFDTNAVQRCALHGAGQLGVRFPANDRVRLSLPAKETNMGSPKDEVNSLLQKLPDDASFEDIQYHLYVLEKVRRGLERADAEDVIGHDAAKTRLGKWLAT